MNPILCEWCGNPIVPGQTFVYITEKHMKYSADGMIVDTATDKVRLFHHDPDTNLLDCFDHSQL